ncbi:MAG TPA: hypothetical protein VND87_01320 [Stellaceae bacterium]|nr:hypothetical protein [Stellaceae bacterium]
MTAPAGPSAAELPEGLFRSMASTCRIHQVPLVAITIFVFMLEVVPLELQRRVINDVVNTRSYRAIVWLCAAYVGAVLAQGLVKLGLDVYRAWVGERAKRDLRRRIFGAVGATQPETTESDAQGTAVLMIVAEVTCVCRGHSHESRAYLEGLRGSADPLPRRRIFRCVAGIPRRRVDRRSILRLGAAAVPQGFRGGALTWTAIDLRQGGAGGTVLCCAGFVSAREGTAVIKTILVPATGNQTDTAILTAALAVGRRFAAHIDALHVRLDPVEVAVATAAGEGSGGSGLMVQGLVEQLEQDSAKREATARDLFTAFCAGEGVAIAATPGEAGDKPSAQFHVEIGQEPRWLANYGMTADLVIAGRGAPGDDAVARTTLEALLLETGRPLLIPGRTDLSTGFAERVAIAWRPTAQAARAVACAMPLLTGAKEVAVLTVEEEEGRRDELDRLVRCLAWHGLPATARRLPPGPDGAAETLLAAAGKAGLLVMGGYGHARLREWVFGGFTQRLLADAPMAVLMAH